MQFLLLFIGLIPSFVWLLFYLQEDSRYPEPRRLIFFVFCTGALFTFVTLFFQLRLNDVFEGAGIGGYSLFSLFWLAAIEEILKFAAVYLAVFKNPYFDEPLDAMVYTIVAALGFAAVENVGAITDQFKQSELLGDAVQIAIFRFVGATLLHTVSSGFVGYYWALGLLEGRPMHFVMKGLGIAILLHLVFNYLILKAGPTFYPIVLLIISAFFLLYDFEKIKRKEHI